LLFYVIPSLRELFDDDFEGEEVELEILDPGMEEDEPIDIPQDGGALIVCQGCELDNKCYPLGYRKSAEIKYGFHVNHGI